MNDVKLGIIQIEGLRELEQRLAQLPQNLERKILVHATQAGARVIQKEAVQLAPMSTAPHILKSYASALFKTYTPSEFGTWIRPGNLKRMIRVKIDKTKSRGYAITYEVYVKNKEAWYWKFVEFGTSKMSDQHKFMRPAFEAMKEAAIKEVEAQIYARLQIENLHD